MAESTTIARLDNVSKRFILHKDKSVKERLLNFTQSRKHRDDFWALQDITLDIPVGETLGLVGHNGSGKSTLLKTIGGIIQPTSGVVRRRGRLAALLELGAGFHPDLSGRDNVYLNAAILGLSKHDTDRCFDAIVEFSGIEEFIGTQVKFYSSGMYVRLAFAVAVHVDPDLLLVDEVLAVGDEPFQRKCMAKIEEFQLEGRTIVFVSHSADQVAAICDKVAVLEHGRMIFHGETDEGIGVLRRSFETDESSKETASAEPDRGVITVSSTEIVGGSAEDSHEAAPDAETAVHISYELNEPVGPWGISVAVVSAGSGVIYRVSTDQLGIRLPTDPGCYEVTITLDRHNLNGGRYSIDVDFTLADGRVLRSISPAAVLEVAEHGIGEGIIRLNARGAVSKIS